MSNINNKVSTQLSMPNTMGLNNIIDDSWSKLLHKVFKSKLTVDRLSSLNNIDVDKSNLDYDTSNLHLNLFTTTNDNNFICSTEFSYFTHQSNKEYLRSSSSLMQDRYYNSGVSIAKLGNKDFYTNSIKENLSLANQTRWSFKMSSISEKLVRDNFNYTQAKQLLGSSVATSASSSNNVWTSSNLSKVKDLSTQSLSRNITALNFFEDSRSWANKKLFFNSSNSLYKLSYEPYSSINTNLNTTSNNSVIAAYSLDYNLSSSLIKLDNSSISLFKPGTDYKNLFTLNSDKTIYQDSYNNFLFSISTTTLIKTPSSYTYLKSTPSSFSFL
jgi:hypothetical protein